MSDQFPWHLCHSEIRKFGDMIGGGREGAMVQVTLFLQ